jgi:hypothetical protein
MSLKDDVKMFLESFAIMNLTTAGRQFVAVESVVAGVETVSLIDPSGDKQSSKLSVNFTSDETFELEIHEFQVGSKEFYLMVDEFDNNQIVYTLEKPEMIGGFYTGTNILKSKFNDYGLFMSLFNQINVYF